MPPELAQEAQEQARATGKTLSGVIQDALRESRNRRLKKQLSEIQGYWSQRAEAAGVLSPKDLDRILEQ